MGHGPGIRGSNRLVAMLPQLPSVTLPRPGAGRKRTTRPPGMPAGSPVRGFRAFPVLRGRVWKNPNRRRTTRSPRAGAELTDSNTASTASSASGDSRVVASITRRTRSAFTMLKRIIGDTSTRTGCWSSFRYLDRAGRIRSRRWEGASRDPAGRVHLQRVIVPVPPDASSRIRRFGTFLGDLAFSAVVIIVFLVGTCFSP